MRAKWEDLYVKLNMTGKIMVIGFNINTMVLVVMRTISKKHTWS